MWRRRSICVRVIVRPQHYMYTDGAMASHVCRHVQSKTPYWVKWLTTWSKDSLYAWVKRLRKKGVSLHGQNEDSRIRQSFYSDLLNYQLSAIVCFSNRTYKVLIFQQTYITWVILYNTTYIQIVVNRNVTSQGQKKKYLSLAYGPVTPTRDHDGAPTAT